MKKPFVRIAAAALLLLFAGAGHAIGFKGLLGKLVADTLPVEELGSELYDVQEGVHAAITESTGIAVPHFYIPVCFDDECLYVDPIRLYR